MNVWGLFCSAARGAWNLWIPQFSQDNVFKLQFRGQGGAHRLAEGEGGSLASPWLCFVGLELED